MINNGSTRREFLQQTSAYTFSAGLAQVPLLNHPFFQGQDKPSLAVVQNGGPGAMVRKAVETLGGIGKFVKKNDVIVVKPNIGFEKKPEFAATTHPDVVGELVKLCLEAGAKKVKVFDNSAENHKRCAEASGIKKATEDAGGEFILFNEARLVKKEIKGELIKEWEIFRDVLEADCIINVPIPKQHGLAGLTLCLKNWMGVIGGKRKDWHSDLATKLVDIGKLLHPQTKLYVVDATRILLRGGPKGGDLKNVKETRTVIASADPIACESRATELFERKPESIDTIVKGAKAKLGVMDLSKISVKTVDMK